MKPAIPVTPLPNGPLGDLPGVNLSLLRLDLGGGLAPGNKTFKLAETLNDAHNAGITRIVSFGGVWSNHLHAVAAVAHSRGWDSVGLVRGADGPVLSAMLQDAERWGMQIVPVSRTEYRRRNERNYLAELERQFAPCLVIPEGGANASGVRGCMAIAESVKTALPAGGTVLLAVGTGTTLAGIVAGLDDRYEVIGIAALKGAHDLTERVQAALEPFAGKAQARWRLLDNFHCGGFARVTPDLKRFMLAFEQLRKIPLEPVYTAKMLYAIESLLQRQELSQNTPMLAVHTGGLQGRRGYDWL